VVKKGEIGRKEKRKAEDWRSGKVNGLSLTWILVAKCKTPLFGGTIPRELLLQ
jgi:hypothetical protein